MTDNRIPKGELIMGNQTTVTKLEFTPEMEHFPLPPSEAGLMTAEAEFFVRITDEITALEGLHFDRTGRYLYGVACGPNQVFRVDMETGEKDIILELDEYAPDYKVSAFKVHRDGRLFIACCNYNWTAGGIVSVGPDGTGFTRYDAADGIVADDMVFDSRGGCYVTDMCGTPTNETGSVVYFEPDMEHKHTIFGNLASPNGIALSTDESVLWVSDTQNGAIIRTELTADGMGIAPLGQSVVYRTTGYMGPDSLVVDSRDNVYCALYGQARVMVFNRMGWPIGQILMPGRAQGLNYGTTHPMIRPGTNEIYICTFDDLGSGACIYKSYAFAEANTKAFYMQQTDDADQKAAEMEAFLEEFRNPSRNNGAMLRAAVFGDEYHPVERDLRSGRFMTTICKNDEACSHIFMLHGGGFELEASLHCDLMKVLADRGFKVTAYDYPLAPENGYKVINEAVYNAYAEFRSIFPEDRIVLMGDSCGTALGLNLLMRLRDEGNEDRPKVMVWPSPAVDMTLSNPRIPEFEKVDPSLTVDVLLLCSERYAPGADWKDPLISPIYAEDMSRLGDMYICYSSVELLRPDTELLIDKLASFEGNTVRSHMCEGLFHDYVLQTEMPETVETLDEIEAFIRKSVC